MEWALKDFYFLLFGVCWLCPYRKMIPGETASSHPASVFLLFSRRVLVSGPARRQSLSLYLQIGVGCHSVWPGRWMCKCHVDFRRVVFKWEASAFWSLSASSNFLKHCDLCYSTCMVQYNIQWTVRWAKYPATVVKVDLTAFTYWRSLFKCCQELPSPIKMY